MFQDLYEFIKKFLEFYLFKIQIQKLDFTHENK